LLLILGKIPVSKKDRTALQFWDTPPTHRTIAGRLYGDVSQILELENLRAHIMQHFNNNWAFHLSTKSRNHPLSVKYFSRHFLCGLLHWNGDHYHCFHCYQVGVFLRKESPDDNLKLAMFLYKIMENICKQMNNPNVLVTTPFLCEYKTEYEAQDAPNYEFLEIEILLRGKDLCNRRECICRHHMQL